MSRLDPLTYLMNGHEKNTELEKNEIKVGDQVEHIALVWPDPMTVSKITEYSGEKYCFFEEGGGWKMDRLVKLPDVHPETIPTGGKKGKLCDT